MQTTQAGSFGHAGEPGDPRLVAHVRLGGGRPRPRRPACAPRSTRASRRSTPPTCTRWARRSGCSAHVLSRDDPVRPRAREQVLLAHVRRPERSRPLAQAHRGVRRRQPAPAAAPTTSTSSSATGSIPTSRSRRPCSRWRTWCARARSSTGASRCGAARRSSARLGLARDARGYGPISNQPPYSLMERDIEEEVLPTCRRLGVGQIVFSPLAQGVLTGKYVGGRTSGRQPGGGREAERLHGALPGADEHDARASRPSWSSRPRRAPRPRASPSRGAWRSPGSTRSSSARRARAGGRERSRRRARALRGPPRAPRRALRALRLSPRLARIAGRCSTSATSWLGFLWPTTRWTTCRTATARRSSSWICCTTSARTFRPATSTCGAGRPGPGKTGFLLALLLGAGLRGRRSVYVTYHLPPPAWPCACWA